MAALPTDSRSRGGATREALIAAAIQVFGRDGFHAASTRAIAEAAGVQQALIGYHFQGKEGLYVAVFEHIARQLRERIGPVADAVDAALLEPKKRARKEALRDEHRSLLFRLVDAALAVMLRNESQWAQLIVREQQEPTQAFTALYEGCMRRLLDLLTRLVLGIRGGAEQDARLFVLTILGQMLVFRIARAGVLRQLGWSAIGDKEITLIQAHVHKTIAAQLSAPSSPRRRAT